MKKRKRFMKKDVDLSQDVVDSNTVYRPKMIGPYLATAAIFIIVALTGMTANVVSGDLSLNGWYELMGVQDPEYLKAVEEYGGSTEDYTWEDYQADKEARASAALEVAAYAGDGTGGASTSGHTVYTDEWLKGGSEPAREKWKQNQGVIDAVIPDNEISAAEDPAGSGGAPSDSTGEEMDPADGPRRWTVADIMNAIMDFTARKNAWIDSNLGWGAPEYDPIIYEQSNRNIQAVVAAMGSGSLEDVDDDLIPFETMAAAAMQSIVREKQYTSATDWGDPVEDRLAGWMAADHPNILEIRSMKLSPCDPRVDFDGWEAELKATFSDQDDAVWECWMIPIQNADGDHLEVLDLKLVQKG